MLTWNLYFNDGGEKMIASAFQQWLLRCEVKEQCILVSSYRIPCMYEQGLEKEEICQEQEWVVRSVHMADLRRCKHVNKNLC